MSPEDSRCTYVLPLAVGRMFGMGFLSRVCKNSLNSVCIFSLYYLISQSYPKGIIQKETIKTCFMKMSFKSRFIFFKILIT